MMIAKRKHLVCWKIKQQRHQWRNESSCIASSKLKKHIVLCLLCCRNVNIVFRRKKYIHKTCIKQCYSLPKSKGEIHQTTRCMMITGYKSRCLMIDECCMLLHGSSDVVSKVCFRIVYFLNSWITRKSFFLFFLDRKLFFFILPWQIM